MPEVSATVQIQMQFSGVAGPWTTVNDRVRSVPIQVRYGNDGTSMSDRVAGTGTMTFALDNSAANSAKLLGYYSLRHANKRSGFALGIGVRLAITYASVTYYKWRGVIESVTPVTGVNRSRLSFITCVDWIDEAAKTKLSGIPIQLNKRSHEIFATILAGVTKQPAATDIGTGQDQYPYALDSAYAEEVTALTEFQRLAMSEMGYIYLKGDTTQGGTLVFEDRRTRGARPTSITLGPTQFQEMDISEGRDRVVNRVQVIAHPRRVDAAATAVLYRLQSVEKIEAKTSLTISGPYQDPDQRATRVGGTAMVNPVATTDYTMNTASDGSGTDITTNFSVTPIFGANEVRLTITNNGLTDGYVTFLQCRGKGVYDYEQTVVEAEDATSQSTYGENMQTFDLAYIAAAATARSVANYVLNLNKDPQPDVSRLSFIGNVSNTMMLAALQREISDKIGLGETVSGVSSTFHINGISITIWSKDLIRCTWTLAPADNNVYWILGQAGNTELGITTRLNYGLFQTYWVLGDPARSLLGKTTRLNTVS